MCGIAGFINNNKQKPKVQIIKQMVDVITHRGPDDKGYEIINNVALGNTRLSIIDLSTKGHMPMWNYNHKYCIAYNGEVVNYQKYRNILQHKGYKFYSNSDTEVIVNMYAEYGTSFVAKLKGMFAIAIWDIDKQELFIARDQFGIKPLHYYLDNQTFIFGSEIKSILKHPYILREINPIAMSHYFSLGFGAISSPITIFKNIYKLPPAHYGIVKNNQLKISRYWQLKTISNKSRKPHNFTTTVKRMTDLIENSVKQQLIADVPLGSFLSGGVDSSLITAIAQKYTKHQIQTFSIGFEDPKFDETIYARQVAKYLKTKHYHKTFSAKELLETLPKIINKLDEPFADASILPTYLLSEFTKQKVTVALSGDGGDEIFGGYPTYIAHKLASPLKYLPKWGLKIFKNTAYTSTNLIQLLPFANHSQNFSIQFKLHRTLESIDKNIIKQHLNFTGPMFLSDKDKLIINHKEQALPYISKLINSLDLGKQANIPQIIDFYIYMSEDCLVKTDRASSFNSLEVRPPFLDTDIINYAFSLPNNYHIKGFRLKHLLKEVARQYIPESIINRPKKGFGIPTHTWLRNELKPQMLDLLNKKRIIDQGLFNFDYINKLIKEHLNHQQDHRMILWNLLIFQLWWEKWMK